jgi:hypothetical protein
MNSLRTEDMIRYYSPRKTMRGLHCEPRHGPSCRGAHDQQWVLRSREGDAIPESSESAAEQVHREFKLWIPVRLSQFPFKLLDLKICDSQQSLYFKFLKFFYCCVGWYQLFLLSTPYLIVLTCWAIISVDSAYPCEFHNDKY